MIVQILWIIFQILVGYNLVLPLILYGLHKISSPKKYFDNSVEERDYGIIVTAYEQTELLPAVVNSLLKLNYTNYLIYIVADKCDISSLNFDDDRVVLLRPPETLASNTRSHLYAIDNFTRPHELLTIIDSDNLVDPEYLNVLNIYFDNGFEAVQGVRKAKAYATNIASMDAARDLYYHFFDGEVLFELGSSATLAGSGMAFTTALYNECFRTHDMDGAGFDKVLQAKILMRDKRIAFAKHAVVFDEKTANSTQLVHQRSRWINTWFKYVGFGFSILASGVKNMSKNQLLFGVILLRPPLFLFILLSLFCLLVNVFVSGLAAAIWLLALLAFVVSFFLALKHGKADERIYSALKNIPSFMYLQVCSLMKIRNANKRSVATRHVVSNVDRGNHFKNKIS
ncbi:glycosyltransferase [Pedobacter sandarakinus]|uniref:glycosyltransferase n=1 Tax=Pedobacter sandarakinus TaxID=353156 RepID=UPI0022451833|nr:glycosyltransferase [Pedobacter sandarakinus]MCX2574875.1 glycosyltransferase [Pedobacter sandarakinus]